MSDQNTGEMCIYKDLIKKTGHNTRPKSLDIYFSNELGCFAQEVLKRMPTGTNTMLLIPKLNAPSNKTVTHGRLSCGIKPQKSEVYCTRFIIGGNLIDSEYDIFTPTAQLITDKLLLISTVSTINEKKMTMVVKDLILIHTCLIIRIRDYMSLIPKNN